MTETVLAPHRRTNSTPARARAAGTERLCAATGTVKPIGRR